MNTDRLCPGCMNDNGGERICSICGYDMSSSNGKNCLPVNFFLSERYVIGKALSENSEAITYIAWDTAANEAVHIKEYYPPNISVRNPDKTVSVLSGNEFVFNEGLMDYLEINKKLIAIELPSVIAVNTVFEENGTVYAVTPVISGITLKSFLDRNGGSLRWEQARPLFLPLIDTVKGMHEIGIIHGGISPETIMVGRDGKLRLTGICIPRIRRASVDSFAELYSGYAAAEQYGKLDAVVGAYSDVYAISATLFRVIIGVTPPSAESRLTSDSLSIPARFADELPRQVLVAIANGMQLEPKNRTDSIDTFRNELVYGETQENIRRAANNKAAEQKAKEAVKQPQKKKGSSVKYAAISCGITAALFLVVGVILCFTVFKDDIFGDNEILYNTSDNVSVPQVESIGDVDPNAVESVILYEVPELLGKYYYQLEDLEDYERFKFSIKGKEYSDKYARGMICAQSVEAGQEVQKETEIQVTISLGPKEVAVANVIGLDEMSAKMELLKQGFLYENIEVVEREDPTKEPGIVIVQTPEYNEKVTAEAVIRIEVNSYEPEVVEDDFSGNSSDEDDLYDYKYD